GKKAEYLTAIAQTYLTADEQFLRHGDYDSVESWLRNIKGIGAWSATFVLVRGLGRMDRVSAEKPLQDSASRVYHQRLDEAGVRRLAARYGVNQGYWAFYLRNAPTSSL